MEIIGSRQSTRRKVARVSAKLGFVVTNLRRKSKNVVKFYNKRGRAEE